MIALDELGQGASEVALAERNYPIEADSDQALGRRPARGGAAPVPQGGASPCLRMALRLTHVTPLMRPILKINPSLLSVVVHD